MFPVDISGITANTETLPRGLVALIGGAAHYGKPAKYIPGKVDKFHNFLSEIAQRLGMASRSEYRQFGLHTLATGAL